jgi:hypothetical protein
MKAHGKRRPAPVVVSSVILLVFAAIMQSSLLAQATNSPKPSATVPFVGCKSDGQAGPLDAPVGKSKVVPLATGTAQRLAYYKAEQGFGVFAPRGWHCFGTYGSSGANLYVSPQPIDTTLIFSDAWKGFAGPVIQLSVEDGDTSGRFDVASIIARVFPAHRAFVRNVIAEDIAPTSDFPFGPYPKDKLVYRSKEIVEYQTPAQTDGLGTRSRLLKSSDPISGVQILMGEPPSLLSLAMRLPAESNDLTSAIIQQAERDADHPHP